MNKYAQTPQATLDLHQHTQHQARAAVRAFLSESEHAGYNLVRIIVGRGIHSKEGPVLGDAVRALLRDADYEFRDAKIGEGAEGAIDVKL
ncbi:hypothetical protein BK004_01910 [bacterium CG10_46_32]|nr:MAG: hypothetical protein BK004_01910 [bacterium CG10_46_32]PIR56191.1 MAG: hypothetical protein COU73_01940 [Parcubacteria group bacterium CG10_big_fil_rev_8_21_14_0_10_46_32]